MASSLLPIPGFADPFSSLSHLLGAAAILLFAVPLLRKARRAPLEWHVPRLSSLAVFILSAAVLLAVSGTYHLLERGGDARPVLRRLDHAAIFILIAGTFTPIHAILFKGPWRWGMLLFIWACAAAGVTAKSVFFTSIPEVLGVALYIAMGWVGVASGALLVRRFSWRFVRPLGLGGVAYTLGAVADLTRTPTIIPGVLHAHELFHLAVLAGLAFHTRFIWNIADAPAAGISPASVRPRG